MAEDEIAASAAQNAAEANQGAEASTVNEIDLRQIQNDLFGFKRQFLHIVLQRAHLVAGDDASLAAKYHNVSNVFALYVELHGPPRRQAF